MIFPNVNFPECGQVEKCELAIPKYEDWASIPDFSNTKVLTSLHSQPKHYG